MCIRVSISVRKNKVVFIQESIRYTENMYASEADEKKGERKKKESCKSLLLLANKR